jgi:FkbM family methyltransferase
MSQCAGQTGKVFAFEPLAYLQEKFNRNMSLNKVENVSLFPFALSDKEDEVDFNINPDSWNQGTFSLSNNRSGSNTQHVIIKVADNIAEIQNLKSLDLIKIDVEGFEYQVLLGLAVTLKLHKPRIIFEYDDNYWLNNGQKIADCYAFLQSLSYTFYQITPVGCELITKLTDIEGGNLFCIPA